MTTGIRQGSGKTRGGLVFRGSTGVFQVFFSLIELLVVISIIAMLVSLLLPALGKARNTAKTLQCAGQLKQLAQCVFSYADDYGGRFPPTNVGGTQSWSWLLRPYFSEREPNTSVAATGALTLGRCPVDTSPKWMPYFPFSYGTNYYLNMVTPIPLRWFHSRTSYIILHSDSDDGLAYPTNANTLSASRHNRKWNSSFLDGHVALIGADIVLNTKWYY